MVVIKRDGTKVPFDKEKIKIAITKAMNEVKEICDYEQAEKIAESISKLDDHMKEISIYDIEDMVEDKLMASKHKSVAKAYIRYRYSRELARNKENQLKKKMIDVINCDNIQNSNANVDEYSFGGRKFESGGIALKEIALDAFISEDVAKAHKENRIYIHDLDSYAIGMANCLFIDFHKLLTEGFTTRNGDVRPATNINTAMQHIAVIFQCQSQVEFGGVASAHIDFDLAPFVTMSFKKHFKNGLKYIAQLSDKNIKYTMENGNISLDNEFFKGTEVYDYAYDMTVNECKQSAQGLYHNLNTLESRAGSQLPFTSINFGRDTSTEGRLITKSLLEASIDGIGKLHKTPIFPISIFQHKKGINDVEGTPNYDLKQLAIKSLCKRIYPNFVNCDFSENIEEDGNPDTYNCTMGKILLI